jgi:hypothetical protein
MNRKLNIFLTIIILHLRELLSQHVILNGFKNYTGMHMGNLNILISAPHGGNIVNISTIENRTNDAIGNLRDDLNTKEIAFVLRDQLIALFSQKNFTEVKPFIVFNNLRR